MALPDYFTFEQGTAIVWGESGASGVTKTLSFDALAAGSARMGASADLGTAWDQLYIAELTIETGTAPTAGGTVEAYLAWSRNGTDWPAGVTGSDGAWPADGNEDEWAQQLGSLPVVTLKATNDGTTTQRQNLVLFMPRARYVVPVIDNNMDQAIRDQATNSNNTSRLILVPYRSLQQDAAP